MPRPLAPCGTAQARKRHQRRQEGCVECGYKPKDTIGRAIVDVLSTHDRWMSGEIVVDYVMELHPSWLRESVKQTVWKLAKLGVVDVRYRDGICHIAEFRADDSAWEAIA